jgi:hypothetical protein
MGYLQMKNPTPTSFAASTRFFPWTISPLPSGSAGKTSGSQKLVTCEIKPPQQVSERIFWIKEPAHGEDRLAAMHGVLQRLLVPKVSFYDLHAFGN